jgi:hypothetical protein
MFRFILSALFLSYMAAVSFGQQVSSVVYVSTFNNIGIEVTFASATPAGGTVAVAVNNAQASQSWRACHPLSRVAANRFTGSVFGLTAGTQYSVRLQSPLFSQDRTDQVTTRIDSFPLPAGTVYHVAKSGSDANTGASLAQAFGSLGRAVSLAQAGATIVMHAGRYFESVVLPRSGTQTAPILIRNAPGETAVLDGRDTSFKPSWTLYNSAANIYRTACNALPYLAYYNGQHLFASPTLADLVANTWSMASGYFVDSGWMYVHLPHSGPPAASDTVTIPAFTTGITCTGRQFIQIKGLEICSYGLDAYSRGVYFDGASNNLVDSCFLHHSGIGVAFKRACSFNTVQHCNFTESPIDTWNWSAVKEGTGYYEAGGVVVYGSPNANIGNVIRGNHFFHMFDGSHLFSDDAAGPTTNMDFCENIIEFVNDDCIETDGAGSNCRIYNNTFSSFLTGVSVAPAAGGPTYIVRNMFRGWETHSGYVGYPVKFNVTSTMTIDWIYLYHNTCFTSVAGQPGFLFKQYSNWNNVISRNNIYAGTGNALESWSTQNPVDFDYDGLYTNASGKLVSWANVNYTALPAFSNATGQEAHGIVGYPAFVDTAAGDFHLSQTSPLVDKGVVITGINDNYLDNGPDIGCFERGAASVRNNTLPGRIKTISLAVYSNKATGKVRIQISFPVICPAYASIYTLSGDRIFRSETRNSNFTIEKIITPGVYIAQVNINRDVCRKEFVVMR